MMMIVDEGGRKEEGLSMLAYIYILCEETYASMKPRISPTVWVKLTLATILVPSPSRICRDVVGSVVSTEKRGAESEADDDAAGAAAVDEGDEEEVEVVEDVGNEPGS